MARTASSFGTWSMTSEPGTRTAASFRLPGRRHLVTRQPHADTRSVPWFADIWGYADGQLTGFSRHGETGLGCSDADIERSSAPRWGAVQEKLDVLVSSDSTLTAAQVRQEMDNNSLALQIAFFRTSARSNGASGEPRRVNSTSLPAPWRSKPLTEDEAQDGQPKAEKVSRTSRPRARLAAAEYTARITPASLP